MSIFSIFRKKWEKIFLASIKINVKSTTFFVLKNKYKDKGLIEVFVNRRKGKYRIYFSYKYICEKLDIQTAEAYLENANKYYDLEELIDKSLKIPLSKKLKLIKGIKKSLIMRLTD